MLSGDYSVWKWLIQIFDDSLPLPKKNFWKQTMLATEFDTQSLWEIITLKKIVFSIQHITFKSFFIIG